MLHRARWKERERERESRFTQVWVSFFVTCHLAVSAGGVINHSQMELFSRTRLINGASGSPDSHLTLRERKNGANSETPTWPTHTIQNYGHRWWNEFKGDRQFMAIGMRCLGLVSVLYIKSMHTLFSVGSFRAQTTFNPTTPYWKSISYTYHILPILCMQPLSDIRCKNQFMIHVEVCG